MEATTEKVRDFISNIEKGDFTNLSNILQDIITDRITKTVQDKVEDIKQGA